MTSGSFYNVNNKLYIYIYIYIYIYNAEFGIKWPLTQSTAKTTVGSMLQ